MKTVAIISVAGGTGKTTLTAALAVLLARRHHAVVAVEMDEQNMLGTLLGLRGVPANGLATHALSQDEPWHTSTYRSNEGVLFVPFGAVQPDMQLSFDTLLGQHNDWLGSSLREISLPDNGIMLIDTARFPGEKALQAVRCADLVLCVVRPDPYGCVLLATHFDVLRRYSKVLKVLGNGVYPARQLHHDVLAMLKGRIGADALLPQRVHLDEVVPQAYARGGYFFDDAPHSQTSHDLQGLASWLSAWTTQGEAQ
jgi:cellulose synthase operon protein YhjQ